MKKQADGASLAGYGHTATFDPEKFLAKILRIPHHLFEIWIVAIQLSVIDWARLIN